MLCPLVIVSETEKSIATIGTGGDMAKLFSKNHHTDTVNHTQATHTNPKGITLDILANAAKGTAQSKLTTARNVAQSTAANVKDIAQDRLAHTKDFAQSTFETTRKATQDRLANVQDSAKSEWQDLLAATASIAGAVGALLYENQRRAQKELHQAQVSLLKTATPIVEKTQDVVVISTRKAGESLQRVADNAKDFTEARQERFAHYQQKRRRNRIIFRIGLLTGVALALFYTPLTGSDVRQRIARQWKQSRSYFGW
jgi:sorbitol-specific phosphotransferase system component IIBC